MLVIAINPGSTSTKVAVYEDENPVFEKNIKHSTKEVEGYRIITDQFEFRKKVVLDTLIKEKIDLKKIDAIVGRGGLIKPIKSGVYDVNEAMLTDLRNNLQGEHASNLGGLIASDLAKDCPNAKVLIADPVVVDEFEPIARISGHPAFVRRSVFHALNQKATARKFAKEKGKNYHELNLIVVHLGGGISVGAHHKGKVIDVNQAIGGEGPFSPERAGSLPTIDVAIAIFDGKYSRSEFKKMLIGKGGLSAYLNTNDALEVENRVKAGDKEAILIYGAMAYQIAKTIGEMYTVLMGEVDAILITGGIAYDKWFVERIRERVHKLADFHVYPGENEMEALVVNGLRVLRGEEKTKTYK